VNYQSWGTVDFVVLYQHFSYQHVLCSSDQVSGQVSYGSVFKGILDGDGKEVAVKVLNLQNQGASKSFMAECKALRNILTPESSEDHNFVLTC
jgi:hypothetical protein